MTTKERRELAATFAAIPDKEERLVLATGRYIGEGFDDARLDTLFLAMPISWNGTLVQYTGRLHRLHPKKAEVRIFDYVDRDVPMLMRMFEKRLRTYRAIGYARGEAPLGVRRARRKSSRSSTMKRRFAPLTGISEIRRHESSNTMTKNDASDSL